jgi:hypothetical protein
MLAMVRALSVIGAPVLVEQIHTEALFSPRVSIHLAIRKGV